MAKRKRSQKDTGVRAIGAIIAVIFGVSISRGINPLDYITPPSHCRSCSHNHLASY